EGSMVGASVSAMATIVQRHHRRLLPLFLGFFAILLISCGSDAPRTALAASSPVWIDTTVIELGTECSEDLDVDVEPEGGVDGVPLVTIWGRPQFGRCRSAVQVDLPDGTTAFEDGTTGMIVELPPAPRT